MAPKVTIGCPNCRRPAAYLRGFAQRGLRAAGAHRRQLEAAVIEHVERDLVPAADLAEQILRRHAGVLQEDGCRRRAVKAHLVFFLTTRDAGESTLDQEGRELLAVDLREDHEEIGEAAVRDPHLLAADRPGTVRQSGGLRARTERIGARSGFAETVGADDLSGDESREILLLLRRRAEAQQRDDREPRLRAERRRKRRVGADGVADDDRGELVESDAAERLRARQRRAAQAHRHAR